MVHLRVGMGYSAGEGAPRQQERRGVKIVQEGAEKQAWLRDHPQPPSSPLLWAWGRRGRGGGQRQG